MRASRASSRSPSPRRRRASFARGSAKSSRLAPEPRRDPERSRELWRLARDTERAWIGTIHGFCRRLLAAHPVAAGLDPRFRVLAEAEAELVAEQAFDAALDEVAVGDGEAEAIAAGFSVWRLRKLIAVAHEQLRSHGADAPELPPMPEPRRSAAAKNGSDGGADEDRTSSS